MGGVVASEYGSIGSCCYHGVYGMSSQFTFRNLVMTNTWMTMTYVTIVGYRMLPKLILKLNLRKIVVGFLGLTDKLKKEKLNDEQLGLQNWVLVVMLR